MKTTPVRRLLSAAAATAVAATGLTVVAAAPGPASAAECKNLSSYDKKDVGTLGVTHTYQKSAPERVGAGSSITYTTRISTSGIGNPYVNAFTDHPPAEITGKPKVKVTALTMLGGILGQPGTPSIVSPIKNGSGWKVTNTGWFVNASHVIQFEYTYPLPKTLTPGAQLTSRGIGVAGTVGVGAELPDLTACSTVRLPNPGEAALGSMDMAGLGSSDGQLSSTGSVEEMLPGVIGGIVGDMIGK